MADVTVVSVVPPPVTADHDTGLSIPPIDAAFFCQEFTDEVGDSRNDVAVDDLDFDFDDLWIPSADDLEELLNPTSLGFDSKPATDSDSHQFAPIFEQSCAVSESDSPELPQFSGNGALWGDQSPNGYGAYNSVSPEMDSHQISPYLNVLSPESNGSNRGTSESCGGDAKVMNYPSHESRGSENCGSNVSGDLDNCPTRSVTSSPNSHIRVVRTEVVNHKVKLEEQSKGNFNSSLLKRKKDCEGLVNNTVESRSIKFQKSNCNSENNSNDNNGVGLCEEDDKRKVRLMRNRESAHLSRQRKKQYVEELEEKVKMMQSTIQNLNAKISYFVAENATLRQQMGCPGAVGTPPPTQPLPPGMFAYPGMTTFPWMPYAPPYMMKPQGSQVPLVPIPRLKPQQPAQVLKTSKKSEHKSKKNVEAKSKKVAGISFIGLLFFVLLFGGFVPLIKTRYGGVGEESVTGLESYVGDGFHDRHHGRILMVNGTASSDRRPFCGENKLHCEQRGHHSGGKPSDDEFVRVGNGSEHLVASLYVPRNDKLVKIDGNLVIHSVLASEKAMSSHGEGGETSTGLAVPGDFSADVPVPGTGRIGARHHHLRALGSGAADNDNGKIKATDGRLQQWFREGLTGPMLSSGMCTEVLQFEVSSSSASGAIVPSTTARNISREKTNNTTRLSKGRRNRRILRGLPIPLPDSSHNITRKHIERNLQKENLIGKKSSPMVVSILVDPKEVADADVNGVMGAKSISRIFVVVLIDSVKYVTYSCVLPFKGLAHHLVTA